VIQRACDEVYSSFASSALASASTVERNVRSSVSYPVAVWSASRVCKAMLPSSSRSRSSWGDLLAIAAATTPQRSAIMNGAIANRPSVPSGTDAIAA
jgi:hypothetical protein